jgi:hypothetical protein
LKVNTATVLANSLDLFDRAARRLRLALDRTVALPEYPTTPDQRYFVVRGRLWRQTNPSLDPDTRDRLVAELMAARRIIRDGKGDDNCDLADARRRVNDAKVALGERGNPWWDDGAPDYNRYLARNTPYADWYAELEDQLLLAKQSAKKYR